MNIQWRKGCFNHVEVFKASPKISDHSCMMRSAVCRLLLKAQAQAVSNASTFPFQNSD
jgi:hypothetical protein